MTARPLLREELAAEYDSRGYLIIPDHLDPEALEIARAEATALCRGQRGAIDWPGASFKIFLAIKGEECVVNAKEVMASVVVTVPPTATLVDAIRLMLDQRISGLPVVDGTGKLVGIITEGDLLRRPELGTEKPRLGWLLRFLRSSGQEADEYARTHSRTVEEVMTRELVTVAEGTPVEHIVELMEARRIKRVLVVNNGRLVGLVSRADLLRELAKILEEATQPAQSDAAIREKILLELRRQGWGPNDWVSALVNSGQVYLKGIIDDERKRAAIRVVAENVPGVRQVHDQLDYLDPSRWTAN